MRSRRRTWRVAGAVAVLLVASACGSRPAAGSDAAGSAAAGSDAAGSAAAPAPTDGAGPQCPTTTQLPAQAEQPLPDGSTTAWVLRCRDEVRAVPGQGRWWFRVAERADTDAAALLAALRRPDGAVSLGTACTDVLILVPYFVLVDAAGVAVRPRVPLDRCGQPQRQALAALRALPFHETTATRLHQEQSQKSIDTGCGQMWTDALTGDTLANTKPAAGRRMWAKTPDAVRVCVWRSVAADQPRLVSAGTVAGPELAALVARLDRLPAAVAPCAPRHQRFAVLQYLRRGWYDDAAYAELDGCRTVLRPDHTLGQFDHATVQLITTLSHR